MALTNEDKDRIQQEEEELYRASLRLHSGLNSQIAGTTAPAKKKHGVAWFLRNLFLILLVFFIFMIWRGSQIGEQKKQAAAVELQLKKVEFAKIKDSFIDELTAELEAGHFDSVITKGTPYSIVDPAVSDLIAKANDKLEENKRAVAVVEARSTATKLLEEKKYKEAWDFAKTYPDSELRKIAESARDKIADSEEGKLLLELKQLRPNDLDKNVELYGKLTDLRPSNLGYQKKLLNFKSQVEDRTERQSAHLEIGKWTWGKGYGYATAEGQVKNLAGKPLKNVMAVASYFDKSDSFITSDSTLIEYNPLLPGQTSPFKVMTRWNPEMHSARIEFKEMFGKTLATYSPRKR